MSRSAKDVFSSSLASALRGLKAIAADLRRTDLRGAFPDAAPEPGYPPGGRPGTSRASAALRLGTATVGAVAGMMPDTASAVDMQQALFQASYASGRRPSPSDFDRLSSASQRAFGNYQTSVGSAQRSAAVLAQFGFDPSTAHGQQMLGQVGSMSLTTGMTNEEVAGIVGSEITNPVMTNRLRMLGYESFDPQGNPKDVAGIADHLVRMVWSSGSPTPDQIQRSLRPGGAMDLMLQSYIPDPGMQMLVRDAILKRTLNGGRYARNDAATMRRIGADDPFLNPRRTGMRYQSSESAKADLIRNSAVTGYNYGVDAASSMNEAMTTVAASANVLGASVQTLAGLMSGLGGFVSTGPGQAVVGALGMLRGAMPMADGGQALLAEVYERIGAPGYVTGGEIVSLARQYVGKVPYVDSYEDLPNHDQSLAGPERGWDCATFTWWVLKQYGIDAPNNTTDYMADTKPKQIPHGQEQPGDFILYMNGAHHIAIFAGGNTIIHAANRQSDTVESNNAFTGWYGPKYTKSIRYWDGGSQGVPNTGGGPASSGTASSSGSSGVATSGSLSAARPAFAGVSLSIGISGLSAKATSILQAINGTAPWASLGSLSDPAAQPATGTPNAVGSAGTSTGSGTYSGPSGKGPKYLKDFIKAHSVSEDVAKILWTIGMRESGGDPNNVYAPGHSSVSAVDPKSSDSPHFDVGMWQVNNRHLSKIRELFGSGADMYTMKDPEKNWQMVKVLSNNFTKWGDWGISGITSSGFTHDFSGWGSTWQPGTENYRITVENDARYFEQYGQYSKGAWRIEDDQIARIHQNEMVLPADLAEEVREEYGSDFPDMTFEIVIESASAEEAARFARTMRSVLEMSEAVMAGA